MPAGGPSGATAEQAAGGTPARARRRHTEQGHERKQQLLEAATRLFASHGYDATRIEDICREAGVAKGLFYWYWHTKLELYTELVRTMHRRLRQAQADAIDPAADPLTQLRQGTAASVRFLAEHAPYFAFLEHEQYGALRNADLMREGGRLAVADITRLVRRAQLEGRVREGDARLMAIGVMGAVQTLSHSWRSGRLDLDAGELSAFVADWVSRALRADAPPSSPPIHPAHNG